MTNAHASSDRDSPETRNDDAATEALPQPVSLPPRLDFLARRFERQLKSKLVYWHFKRLVKVG